MWSLPITLPCEDALRAIEADLKEAAATLKARGYDVVVPRKPSGEDVKLFIRSDNAEVTGPQSFMG
ncbi:hypothetical protein SAMN05518800_6896 [Variovorax sp. YR752]|nr:hypothetical protein SAMN05518800_6896 [Variovorax sp. YR752]